MVKGLYTAYTGMINEQNRLDILSNNLANADTNGIRKRERQTRRLQMSLRQDQGYIQLRHAAEAWNHEHGCTHRRDLHGLQPGKFQGNR